MKKPLAGFLSEAGMAELPLFKTRLILLEQVLLEKRTKRPAVFLLRKVQIAVSLMVWGYIRIRSRVDVRR